MRMWSGAAIVSGENHHRRDLGKGAEEGIQSGGVFRDVGVCWPKARIDWCQLVRLKRM